MLRVDEVADGTVLAVRVQPRAAPAGPAGVRDGCLVVKVTAAPVDGAANQALLKLLAKALGRPPRDLQLVAGEHRREKRVLVRGATADEVRRRLEELC
ncbi:MAG: DUF167 domain-containing protein [Fimbriimonadaceae bacterium]|nr:DUF167 domain-containing protein [Fimbriimonadaceae bacterium]